jgi:hypothetical protein
VPAGLSDEGERANLDGVGIGCVHHGVPYRSISRATLGWVARDRNMPPGYHAGAGDIAVPRAPADPTARLQDHDAASGLRQTTPP